MHWRQIQPLGRTQLAGDDCNICVVDKCLYMFIGKFVVTDEIEELPMQVLDTETMRLSPLTAEEEVENRDIPVTRSGHSASVVRDEIYIFGGVMKTSSGIDLLDNLEIFNTTRRVWRSPFVTGTQPEEREGHSAAVVGSLIYIFGGRGIYGEGGCRSLGDLHVLETIKMAWMQPKTSGGSPSAREGHSASVVGKTIVIFGGGEIDDGEDYTTLSDLHLLNTATMHWTQPVTTGTPPTDRRYHTTAAVGQRVFIFGGEFYDKDHADRPDHLEREDTVYIVHTECEKTLYELDLDSNAWTQHADVPHTPMPRCCHAAAAVGTSIFVFGGRRWDEDVKRVDKLNDLHVLDTRPSSTLALDWRRFLNSEEFSDLTLLVQGRRIAVHRVVLASRCGYFRRMFESGMREASEQQVKITDVSYPVMMALLDHLYSDTLEVPANIELELFAAADRFGLERLKQVCATAVESSLSVENVCYVLAVAEQHNSVYLVESSVAFIVAHFAELHGSDGIKDLPPSLLALVHAAIASTLFPGYVPPAATSSTARGASRGIGKRSAKRRARGRARGSGRG